MNEKQTRAEYTLQFKQEAVRQVKAGSAPGYLSPMQFEQRWLAAQRKSAA